MKNTAKSILFTLAILTSFSINAQKLGHVNSQAIVQEMPDYESARQELESYKNDLAKELEMYQKLTINYHVFYTYKKQRKEEIYQYTINSGKKN